ncbi:hypothetical protein K474DRAFT_1711173 [Panus rudis PR-1116 ss-1]|nr:hypothetical protein K474DRAFT_1711173 [Panus rudis PR-1116 ss-1]
MQFDALPFDVLLQICLACPATRSFIAGLIPVCRRVHDCLAPELYCNLELDDYTSYDCLQTLRTSLLREQSTPSGRRYAEVVRNLSIVCTDTGRYDVIMGLLHHTLPGLLRLTYLCLDFNGTPANDRAYIPRHCLSPQPNGGYYACAWEGIRREVQRLRVLRRIWVLHFQFAKELMSHQPLSAIQISEMLDETHLDHLLNKIEKTHADAALVALDIVVSPMLRLDIVGAAIASATKNVRYLCLSQGSLMGFGIHQCRNEVMNLLQILCDDCMVLPALVFVCIRPSGWLRSTQLTLEDAAPLIELAGIHRPTLESVIVSGFVGERASGRQWEFQVGDESREMQLGKVQHYFGMVQRASVHMQI